MPPESPASRCGSSVQLKAMPPDSPIRQLKVLLPDSPAPNTSTFVQMKSMPPECQQPGGAQTPTAKRPNAAMSPLPCPEEPCVRHEPDCSSSQSGTMLSNAAAPADEETLRPILRELDTMRVEAAAVLMGRRSETGDQQQPQQLQQPEQQQQQQRERERTLQACGMEEQVLDESRRRSQAEHVARQREIVSREQQLAAREQELASRETGLQAGLRDREQHVLSRERRCADREVQLAEQERRLADREAQVLGREKRLADREADLAERWEKFATRREEVESLNSELEQFGARLRGEEEKMKEWRRQLEERELRWSEACNEAHLIKHYHPKRRLSPRSGKENQELQRQLEEQQSRMHEIKRQSGSWSPDSGNKGGSGLPFPVTPPTLPAALGENKAQRCYGSDLEGFPGMGR